MGRTAHSEEVLHPKRQPTSPPPSHAPEIAAQLCLLAHPSTGIMATFSNLSWSSSSPSYLGPSYRCPCWSDIHPPVISLQLLSLSIRLLPLLLLQISLQNAAGRLPQPLTGFLYLPSSTLLATGENSNRSLAISSLPPPCPLTPPSVIPSGAVPSHSSLSPCSRHAVPRTHPTFPNSSFCNTFPLVEDLPTTSWSIRISTHLLAQS